MDFGDFGVSVTLMTSRWKVFGGFGDLLIGDFGVSFASTVVGRTQGGVASVFPFEAIP